MKNSYKYFENRDCIYYPCHEGIEEMNCLFCYCPLYLKEVCAGEPVYIKVGDRLIKDCSGCTFPHRPENYEMIIDLLSK